jgi:hypothetical protein
MTDRYSNWLLATMAWPDMAALIQAVKSTLDATPEVAKRLEREFGAAQQAAASATLRHVPATGGSSSSSATHLLANDVPSDESENLSHVSAFPANNEN